MSLHVNYEKFDMLTYFFGTNSVVVLSPDCTIEIDKPYHMNNRFQQMWAEIKNLWNYALICSIRMYK